MARCRVWGRVAIVVTLGMLLGLTAAHAVGPGAAPVRAGIHAGASHRLPQRAPHPPRSHRAKLPSSVRITRHAPGSKAGTRLASIAGPVAMPAMAARPLEPRQATSPDAREHPVTGGRGPPRASPTRASRGRAFLAPAFAVPPDARSRASLAHRFRPDCLPRFIGRMHVARLEGAMACFTPPSIGGSPCPASQPSRRSRSAWCS
jgi:hypothetical protein